MREMTNTLLGWLRKIVRVLSMVLRWIFFALIGSIALIMIGLSGLYVWEEIRFIARTPESDARSSFISYCKRTCFISCNEFDGPQLVSKPSSSEYIFAWHEHNHPERRIEVTLQAHNELFSESKQFADAHPWESRVVCQSKKN